MKPQEVRAFNVNYENDSDKAASAITSVLSVFVQAYHTVIEHSSTPNLLPRMTENSARVAIKYDYINGPYSTGKLLKHHKQSAIRHTCFGKWGWICDSEREKLKAKPTSQTRDHAARESTA
jgi:hypothetical protein